MNFPERLKRLREESSLTQSELAKKLNISRQSVNNYENGTRFPNDVQILIKMSKIFSVSVDYLIGISNIRFSFENEHIKNPSIATEQILDDSFEKKEIMKKLFFELDDMSVGTLNKIIKCIKIFKEDN